MVMNTSLLTPQRRPFSHQLFRWSFFSLITTIILYGGLFICERLCFPGWLTWGLHLELFLFFFFIGIAGAARRRAKKCLLSRQFLDLMKQSITAPDEATQQQLQHLQTSNQVQLGFAVLILRIANGLFKLTLLAFAIHITLLILLD